MVSGVNRKKWWIGLALLAFITWPYFKWMAYKQVPGDTKVNVFIKAVNSDRVLKLSTRACHLADGDFKRKITQWVYLKHTMLAFTGNINETYHCPVKKSSFIDNLGVQSAPIAGYDGLEGQFESYQYLKNISTLLPNTKLLGSNDKLEVYNSHGRITILLKNQPIGTHPMKIEHSQIHRGDVESTLLLYYNVRSLIGEDFMIEYKVAATDKVEVEANSPAAYPIDAGFAREFHHVLKTEGELGILNHPEIIDKFIENNEKVVRYVKSISVEYDDADEKPRVEIVKQ